MKHSIKKENNKILIRDDQNNGITQLTLNRPDKYNALSSALLTDIQIELDRISQDPNVRVVILAGEGTAFCAGHDIQEIMDNPSEPSVKILFQKCSKMMLTLTKMPQPIIAKIHGLATAAGCQLVAQCDLAIASDEATFATSGIGIGLFCGTPSVAVTRNMPRKQAMELLFTGEFIDARKALEFGLVNQIAADKNLDDATEALALKITQKGPEFISRGKALFYNQIEQGLESAYEQATKFMIENMQLKSTQSGLNAFLNKKPMPDW